ncbi:MAG: phenylalanine--tRNA ligase subunit alpha [Enterobacterales bacterium]
MINVKNVEIEIKLIKEAILNLKKSKTLKEINEINIKFLGKKGLFNKLLNNLHKLSLKKRSFFGCIINENKQKFKQVFNKQKNLLIKIHNSNSIISETLDVTLLGNKITNGTFHPVTHTISYIENFFENVGFQTITGQEIEDVYHNFDALNINEYHPSRTEHDTFWFNKNILLRTQTSNIQIRSVKNGKPPIKLISPGRVYRNDSDNTHTPMFHQVEGIAIDTNLNFSNLKKLIYDFLYSFFTHNICIRFRPSYFPFTEISAEVEIKKNNNWIEILGCGMICTNILRNLNINPKIYSGFAFGLGVERLAMIKYNLNDVRTFFKNDIRFLRQFK